MATTRGREIIAIDLLRFACGLMVVAYHFGAGFGNSPSPHAEPLLAGFALPRAWAHWTWFGWIGVELFFVISGIVIARSAVGTTMSHFIRRRALRLVPAAWLCATTSLLILVASGISLTELLAGWARSVTFWPMGNQIDGAYWTLGIECIFYLVVASQLRTGGDPVRIERTGMAIGLWSAAYWAIGMIFAHRIVEVMDIRDMQLSLLPHGCLFALGMTITAISRSGPSLRRITLLAVFFIASLCEIATHSAERAMWLHVQAGPAIPMALFTGGVALLLLSGRLQPCLAATIGSRVAITLGLMTYPLYLIHQDAGAAVIAGLMRRGFSFAEAAASAAALALAFAWAIARLAEPWLGKKLSALIDRIAAISARRGPVRDTHPSASPPAG